jgi:hypothetical protein
VCHNYESFLQNYLFNLFKKDWQRDKSNLIRRILNAWRNQAEILNKIESPIILYCT